MLVLDRAGRTLNTISFPDASAVASGQQGPYVVGSTLYVSNGKTVYAYDTASLLTPSPKPLWGRTFPGLYVGSMVVDEAGNVFVGSAPEDRRIVALDQNGQQRWEVRTVPDNGPFAAVTAMSLSGDILVVAATGGGLQAYDKTNGKPMWNTFPGLDACQGGGSGVVYQMEIAEDKVFLGHAGGHCISAWNLGTGKRTWVFEAPNRVTFNTRPKYVRGVLYASNSKLWAIDAGTGQALAASAEDVGVNIGTPVQYDPVSNQVLVWSNGLFAYKPLR